MYQIKRQQLKIRTMTTSIEKTEELYNYDFSSELEEFADRFQLASIDLEDIEVSFEDTDSGIEISLILRNADEYGIPSLYVNEGRHTIMEYTEPEETSEFVRESVLNA